MKRLPQRLNSLLKNTILILLLGGAAVHRCDNRRVCSAGFTGGGKTHGGAADFGCSAREARCNASGKGQAESRIPNNHYSNEFPRHPKSTWTAKRGEGGDRIRLEPP
jgi:hypothetical protein